MKINVTKNEIAKELSDYFGFSNLYSKKIINDLINCIIIQVSKSDVYLKNFGIFKTSQKKQRIGRNPKTKEEFIIKARKSLRFVPSEKFKIYLNEL